MTLLDKPYGTGDEYERWLIVDTVFDGQHTRRVVIPFAAIDDSPGSFGDALLAYLASIDAALPDTLDIDGGLKVHVMNPGSGGSFDTSSLAQELTLLPVRNRFAPSEGASLVNPVMTSGDNTVYTPAAGNRVRLKWVGLSTPDNNPGSVVAKWRFGVGSYFWPWVLGKPGAFAHGAVREGDVDEPLILNLDASSRPVYVGFDLEEF